MTEQDQHRVAVLERIARYTVGIAVDRNTAVGTGTLVFCEGHRHIVTAAHVIGEAKSDHLRFWFRPPAPIKEKAATLTTQADVGRYSAGVHLRVSDTVVDNATDIAILKLEDSFEVPEGSEFYEIERSSAFLEWPKEMLEGVSLILFGFPTDNSRSIAKLGDHDLRLIGCAEFVTRYSTDLNATAWSRLPRSMSSKKDFVFEYLLDYEDIGPHGFSGCGVWVLASDPSMTVWRPDPRLIGVAHTYFKKSGIMATTKLSSFLLMAPSFVAPHSIHPST